jgi:uncharacterized protein YjbJ (UPF0337 family)
MRIWEKAKAKAEELYGRAEEIYGESHGDAAAEVRGEAHVAEAEDATDREGTRRPDDGGLTGAR